MNVKKIDECISAPFTALLYCAPGVGKSTAIGVISEASEGNTLVLDVDRTIGKTLAKGEVVKDTSKLMVVEIENRSRMEKDGNVIIPGTYAAWTETLKELGADSFKFIRENNIKNIAVDNISELERCILSDLGAQGKNKGVPAQADYQYMQFKMVNSLRYMKNMGVNVIWTAWEDTRSIVMADGSSYSQLVPRVSPKIVDNICGLCDVVGRIMVNKDGVHGIMMAPTQSIYAKNQIDARKGCLVEEFINFNVKKKEEKENE